MEIYLLIRVIMLLWSHKRLFDDDIRVSRPLARVLSLFVFDMMTVVPDATPTTLPAQFIPFSVGAILVMVTFNWKKHTSKTDQTSRVQSLIIFSKPPATGDPLLVPTPFTLHFPREHRTSHSWRSDAGGPIPESSEEQDVLDITGPSRPLSAYSSDSSRRSARSVDNAVITRAVPAYTGSPRTVALPPVTPPSTSYYPVSAPPQLSGFTGNGPSPENQPQNPNVVRKILPSQVEYAAELEREQARLEEEIIRLAQPAVPPLPLDGPRGQLIQRDADEITIYSQSQYRNSTNTYRPMITPASAFFSQDVQRNRSNRKTGRMNSTRSTMNPHPSPSPAPTQGSFAFSPYESVRSYFRESYDSRLTRASEDESQVSGGSSNGSHGGSIKRKDGSGSASASGKRNTFLSPTDSLSSKLPWKSNNLSRFSLASMRSRSREELPTVREQSPESGDRQRQRVFPMPRPTVVIGRVPSSSKRRTFGQAGTPTGSTGSGRRASNRPSILNLYGGRPISSLPPMPSTLPTPQRVTPFTPFTASQSSPAEVPPVPQIRELPVPSLQVLPATPEPAYVPGTATPPPASTNADGPTPAWISRPIRSSIVRGPRPLPSAPIITPGMGRGVGSGWPTALQVSGGPPGISGPSLTEVSPASSYGGADGQLDPRRIDGGSEGYLTRSSTRRTRSNSCPSMYSVDSPVEDDHGGEDARSL
ncbi:hypothetical protein BC629DRAFT_290952 [Irpex lacteus]|nr:hypothetical protein BC629DRAFT_290952 [Irpex lacteus]